MSPMPSYVSRAQQRKIHQLASEGKIKPEVVAAMDDATKGKKLPERVGAPSKPKPEDNSPAAVIRDTMRALNS